MDFNQKQWRHESEEQDSSFLEGPPSSLKLPKLVLNSCLSDSFAPALPLFVPQPTTNLSATYSSSSSDHNTDTFTKSNPRRESYFRLGQWQEIELQALIYRHMIAGAAVPPELLHLVRKSLVTPNPPTPYYFQHYYPQYQPSLVQSGYWGRAAMDPEPGRCRRTDGKKWRCSRDVVHTKKYCERHVHRGKNRSRKPVEIPTSVTINAAGESLKTVTNNTIATRDMFSHGGNIPHFTLSGPSPSMDLLHLSSRPEIKGPFEAHNNAAQSDGGRTLRHFFDDWPKSLSDADSTINSATNLSISTWDFSLKLGTGDGDESSAHGERERPPLNWASTWESSPMGGPLAEALRSSTSNNSSPTSVLESTASGSHLRGHVC